MKIIHYISDFLFKVKRSFQFMKIGWKDYDWDYDYMLQFEEKKLKWMRDYFASSEITSKDADVKEKISLALKMLSIIRCSDSACELVNPSDPLTESKFKQTRYVNTHNWKRFLSEQSEVLVKNINSNENIGIIIRDDLRIEKAWNIYNKLRKEKMREWWD